MRRRKGTKEPDNNGFPKKMDKKRFCKTRMQSISADEIETILL
jgi:hypothetical protein